MAANATRGALPMGSARERMLEPRGGKVPRHTLQRYQYLGGGGVNTTRAPPAAAAAATPTRSPQEKAEANAQVAISMQANMRATGHSSEEISAALVQLFLNCNCPAVNPDETGQEMNVDEFEHTEVEQQRRGATSYGCWWHWRDAVSNTCRPHCMPRRTNPS